MNMEIRCSKCGSRMKKSKTHSHYCPECERQRTIREIKAKRKK